MNELKLLEKILPTLHQRTDVIIAPGDDCAAVKTADGLLLLGADQLISGVHYLADTQPEQIAAKLLKRNLSDIAAMGGVAEHALVTIASSRDDEVWFEEFYHGLNTVAATFNIAVCGGDLAALPQHYPGDGEILSLTIIGRTTEDKLCLRSNAKPGDFLYATGCFGNSFASEHHLQFTPRMVEGKWLADNGFTRAMIDVSDGLLLDLERLSRASQLDCKLDIHAIPRRAGADIQAALGDGEDYELLFSVAPDLTDKLTADWPFTSTPLSCIGQFSTQHSKGTIFDNHGNNLSKNRIKGYEHNIC